MEDPVIVRPRNAACQLHAVGALHLPRHFDGQTVDAPAGREGHAAIGPVYQGVADRPELEIDQPHFVPQHPVVVGAGVAVRVAGKLARIRKQSRRPLCLLFDAFGDG